MGNYKCPWCDSMDTGRHTHSYVNHTIKGSISVAGRIALAFFGPKSGFGGQASNATDNALDKWMDDGCYDCVCKKCGKSFYVYYEGNQTKEIRKYRKHSKW